MTLAQTEHMAHTEHRDSHPPEDKVAHSYMPPFTPNGSGVEAVPSATETQDTKELEIGL